ncbi:proteasome activator subunit 4 isoform X2 [Aristolochia californica]|uniref:proteasome activator subunit 4 isoform X2 n=1 Tax=Aristolochia californica TaxID=171875 RepID=UPI0035DDEB16
MRRWGNLLVKLLKKHGKKLSVRVPWRPLYDTLMHTHFKRNTGPEGWRLRQSHFEAVTSLVQSCKKFFPAGSASEIWSEFRALLENPWHNSSFEGSGFVNLFLPTNMENKDFYSQDWIEHCLELWNSIPNCQFWDIQWTAVIAQCIKSYSFINWEQVLSVLFTRYLNMFEVPVGSGNGTYPYSLDVPKNTKFLFSSKVVTPAKAIAKSIVYLLKPGSLAQEYFEKMIDLLEPYYHPSNGGRWTYSLERFLRYLLIFFQKRLQREQQKKDVSRGSELHLGKSERSAFVKVVIKLIDRGQYSKNGSLSETVAAVTSILAYVEPSVVLPFISSRFHLALETMTATHQLKTAVTSVAFAGRALLFSSLAPLSAISESIGSTDVFIDLLMSSLSNALLGMDANDPPKTLASMQLIASIFSNLSVLDDNKSQPAFLSTINFSEWLDEFFCRLFSLLQHLEPSGVLNEGIPSSATSGTFLVEDGPYYFCMLEILLGKLSKPLYNQALRKISKFVKANILPGAIAEVGLLCCACVHSNPEESVVHLLEPILISIISSLRGTPVSGFGGRGFLDASFTTKATLSPALETAVDYQLKILSVAISYAGPAVLRCKDQLKEAIASGFEAPSWKVNGATDHLLRSLLGSMVLYYPVEQYRCLSCHPLATALEEWVSTKDNLSSMLSLGPRWHIPSDEEMLFANELLELHFESALCDLLRICKDKIHTEPGCEKEHLKVTLLRINSSVQGVLSCLPDFQPSCDGLGYDPFIIAGASGAAVGTSELREKAAETIHTACKYLLEQRSDDSILLILVIRIMDALGNFGNLEYDDWSNHRQAWRLESAAIIEPPTNFILSMHGRGKRRPRWALVDKTYMHNTWRSSQALYHIYRTNAKLAPSKHVVLLMDNLLKLSQHNYETVRSLAGKSLLKMLRRWPFLISKCVLTLTESLGNPNAPDHAVLGSCSVLATQIVLRHLTTDLEAFSSFLLGILSSSHHESLQVQKAINELFIKYNIYFAGISRRLFRTSDGLSDRPAFLELVSQIGSKSFDSSGIHWRYNLMANRVLLLLTMASRSHSNSPSRILGETAGHFLKSLKSQLPQTRMLAISALNILLHESPHRLSNQKDGQFAGDVQNFANSSLEEVLSKVFQEEGFFAETLNSLSHVHIITDTENTSSRGNRGMSSFQSLADKSITNFYFDFSASWPRTPSWISLLGRDTFYSNFARIFKRLIQECGIQVLSVLHKTLEEFSGSKERSKQCVAAEALAGVLHSDINGLLEAWDNWIMNQLEMIILAPSVDSIPEWAACIRYAVTGKGKYGKKVPLLRQRILDCLVKPLPELVATNVVAKRYAFLSVALIEVSPPSMPITEVQFHEKLLQELLDNMMHSSAQVREAIGVTLSVLCSNMRLLLSHKWAENSNCLPKDIGGWNYLLIERASEAAVNILNINQSDAAEPSADLNYENGFSSNQLQDIRWMETMFHFIISSLKSGRSSHLLDLIVGLLYPVFSLQEISYKDLSLLAKAAFELFKWRIIPQPHLQRAVSVLLSSANDPNWRTRFTTLTYLRTFMYRHTFILSNMEKQQIWETVEKLLVDTQVEVREHAAAVLASLLKGADGVVATDFRERAFRVANSIQKTRRFRNKNSGQSLSSVHGAVLALAASALSVPYDMPSWLPDHVTLLAWFISEPSPVRSTVMKSVAEFRRTHADTWNFQKDCFTEEQLEVLADTSSSSSYFA